MFYTGYMRRGGGCPTCGVRNNDNFRNTHSPEMYNINRFSNNFNRTSNNDLFQESYSPYNNRLQRIMTPPRNNNYFNLDDDYSNINRNNYDNYNSPSRNGGCRSCSMSSLKAFNDNNYQRPNTGNYMNRTNNIYTFSNNNNNSLNYLNNHEYNFRKRYNNNNNDVFEDSFKQNRYYSPLREPQRNLVNSFSSSNINNNNYSYHNNLNYYNNNNNYVNRNNNTYENNNNNFNIVKNMLNNRYRNFLNDNINKYNYDDSKNNNYNRTNNKNYYSPSYKYRNTFINNRNNNNNCSNSRYNYLMSDERRDNYDKFIMLNLYNYQRKIREMIQERKTFFIFIYGSHDYTGQSWCSDCNIAMPNVEDAKNKIKNNNNKEIYFIDIPIDKINMQDLANDTIIQLERVPTLIYFQNGMERDRLIENDLFSYQTVNNFVLQALNNNSYSPNRNQFLYQQRNYY